MLMKMGYIYARLQLQLGHAAHLARDNAAGYSIVLFGLIMIQCTQGDYPYTQFFGANIRKIYLPFIYLLVAQVFTNGQADLVGHLCGVLAALALKYLFLYDFCALPRYTAIKVVDSLIGAITCHLLEKVLAYYPARE